MRKLLLLVLLCILAAWLFILLNFRAALSQQLQFPEAARTLLVGKGDTLSSILRDLETQGILRRSQWLIWHARLNEATLIRTGEYELTHELTGEELLLRLSSGRVLQYQVTFIEGSTLADAMKILASQPKLIDDIKELPAIHYEKLFGFSPDRAEGWFFPDTYSFVSGSKVSDVLLQSHRRLRAILDEEWQKRAKELPYDSPYDALIMASIIEKETGVAHERAEIAGVFVRRLQKGMRLQTDPTVIYGLGAKFSGNLKRSQLKEPTPYNTYVIDGLPPTPIALVGRESIHAALHPASGDALFFVAKGDGTHVFSSTLAEHERAVNRFQMQRSADYRSSPQVEGSSSASKPNETPAINNGSEKTESVTP